MGRLLVPRRGTPDAAAIAAEEATFRNARLGLPAARCDPRPASSASVATTTSWTSTPTATSSTTSNGRSCQGKRELALEQNPLAIGFVNERIIYTHGIGAAMVPVNEVANEGQPRLFIRNLPPVSSDGVWRSPSHGSTSASGRRTTSSPAPDRPSSSISRPARARAAPIPGRRRAGPAEPGSTSAAR